MTLVNFVRQFSILMGLPAVVVIGLAAAAIVILRDWRVVLLAFAILSAGVALLLAQAIPTEWALLQAIVGGLVAVMLFLSARQLREAHSGLAAREARWPQLASLTSFRLLAVALAVAAFLVVRDRVNLPAVGPLMRDAIIWLGLMGVLGLALHEEPLHAGLALLMVLSGFLLLLFHLTQSRILVGMMDTWQLLLGLAVSYLTVARGLAGAESPVQPRAVWRRP